MRRLFLILLIAGLPVPSLAASQAQGVTVAQLDQFMAGVHGQSDSKVARQLDEMVLTERVGPAQLARWQANLPGSRSRQALTMLADASAFYLRPPSSWLPDPPPDPTTQSAILARVNDYVTRTLARLPDLSALRTTQSFDNAPLGKSTHPPLHFTGSFEVPVTYSKGVESRGAKKLVHPPGIHPGAGLETTGEFGPILSVVLDDAARGSIQWAHWEQTSQGKLAVFHYTVPQRHSSFLLAFTQNFRQVSVFPAYSGEIAVDPATGAIFHISILTGSLRAQNVFESVLTVDYDTIQLGGKNYICPVKGVAIIRSIVDTPGGGTDLRTELNDTAFTGYHVMRGDLTILPADTPVPQ